LKRLYALSFLLLCLLTAKAQYEFREENLTEEVSILNFASILNTGAEVMPLSKIIDGKQTLPFKPLSGQLGNLGFTSNNFWVKFQIKNTLKTPLVYYLQTAEPVTDNANLFLIDANNTTQIQRSGDNLDFSQRSLKNRKTLFKIELNGGETKSAFLELKNDGEKNTLPLLLISQERFLETTYSDQLIMGIFYGILAFIAITYFFFYFAIKEISFLYYSLYVLFVGLCQFALDGFYHQYIGTGNSWFNLHIVIISAIFSCFFFGKYSEIILEIKRKNQRIHKLFNPLYIALGVVLVGIIIFPFFLKYSYPIINILTLFGLILIFASIAVIIYKKQPIDLFYTIGIAILALTIIMAVLMNFGVFPENFFTDNITKLGIGLEIMALSLSMANRIGILRNRKEELQNIALQKSEEMNDMKSYFLSNMSHELRTPLNAILGLAAIMEKESNDPKVIANCEIIKYSSHGLISSVNDILDFSKIEKGDLELDKSEFILHELLNKLAISAEKRSHNKGLKFNFYSSLDKEMVIIGDPIRLEQIIYNVLGNAIKFTSKGNINLEIVAEAEQNMLLLKIIIKDTGIGIAKEKLETIFDLFSQTNFNNKRKHGGFGIGLSIVKALTDLHKGEIKIQSELNEGTTCEIEIKYPIQESVKKPITMYPEDDYDLMGKNILVVEDNPMNQMIVQMMLEDWKNTTVTLADNGAECLETMKTKDIDLVLMDLQMPVMDGYEAISSIRNGLAGINKISVPIIVLTADITKATKDRIFNIGATDYMNKPVEEEILYKKITTALSAHHQSNNDLRIA